MPRNPVLSNRTSILLYILMWALLMTGHAGFISYFFIVPLPWSFLEALVYDGIFGGMSLGIWYTIRYLSIDNQRIWTILLNHAIVAGIFISIWCGVCDAIFEIWMVPDLHYQAYNTKALPLRVFWGVLYYCFLVLAYYLHVYYVSFKKNQLKEAKLKSLVKESELSLLKSQLNPHFIFNSLNSVSALTMINPTAAQEMVIKLSEYIRYALKQHKNEFVTFSEELRNSMLYLEIEKIRFGDKLVIEQQCESDSLRAMVPNMLLQPLLENAIKYGVYESTEPVIITLRSFVKEEMLYIEISNSFDTASRVNRGTGIGLRHVKERMQLLFGVSGLVQVAEKINYYVVTISIPQLFFQPQ